eukprot:6482459-Amphidinium_carterae.3
MEATPVINYGAARGFRVQRDTVAKNALHFLAEDLNTIDDERALGHFTLFQNVLSKDRKCALATFQAKSGAQRFRAVVAALERMGLADKASMMNSWVPLLAPVCQEPRAPGRNDAHATSVHRSSGMESSSCDASSRGCGTGLIPPLPPHDRLQRRVDALEAWAHLIDGQLEMDERTTDAAVFRASELLDAMAKQVVKDAILHDRDEIMDRLHAVEAGIHSSTMESVLAADIEALKTKVDMIMNIGRSAGTPPDVQTQAFAAKIAGIEHQLDLCMRLCRRTVTGASQLPAQVTRKVAEHAQLIQQTSEMIRVHTIAITRNWQWTASVVRAHSQPAQVAAIGRPSPVHGLAAASTAGMRNPFAPPPPPPPAPPSTPPPPCSSADQETSVQQAASHASSCVQPTELVTPTGSSLPAAGLSSACPAACPAVQEETLAELFARELEVEGVIPEAARTQTDEGEAEVSTGDAQDCVGASPALRAADDVLVLSDSEAE